MSSPVTTQIISFATKVTVDFKYLSNAVKAGATELHSQHLGSGLEEPEARHWFLGKLASILM